MEGLGKEGFSRSGLPESTDRDDLGPGGDEKDIAFRASRPAPDSDWADKLSRNARVAAEPGNPAGKHAGAA